MIPFFSKINKKCLANSPYILYLCAISFHNKGPSSTSTSKVSHNTIHWNVLQPKHQRVQLALGRPFMDGKKCTRKQKLNNFCLKNISFSHYVHISFDLISTCFDTCNKTAQHNFGCFYNTVRIRVMQRELVIALHAFYLSFPPNELLCGQNTYLCD